METIVGIFMLLGIGALLILSYKVSGLTHFFHSDTYAITASFENIGDLKTHAPVTLAGVKIGEVRNIKLYQPTTENFEALVTMYIDKRYNKIIAENASAKIQTAGLLGANYIALVPGYITDNEIMPTHVLDSTDNKYLHNGSKITNTQSALILEDMISHFLYSFKNNSSNSE